MLCMLAVGENSSPPPPGIHDQAKVSMPNKLEADLHDQYSDALQSMANDCRDDAELRARVDADPRSVFADRGLPYPEDTEVRVVRNTAEVFHLTMPPDPNVDLSDAMLGSVSGGHTPHTSGGPTGCASTASTIPSCIGTFGCSTSQHHG